MSFDPKEYRTKILRLRNYLDPYKRMSTYYVYVNELVVEMHIKENLQLFKGIPIDVSNFEGTGKSGYNIEANTINIRVVLYPNEKRRRVEYVSIEPNGRMLFGIYDEIYQMSLERAKEEILNEMAKIKVDEIVNSKHLLTEKK